MTRLIVAASLIAVASTATLSAAAATRTNAAHPVTAHRAAAHAGPSPHHSHLAKAACKVAPADEYFGKLKMSILGIRNTIKDQGLKIDVDPAKAPGTMGAIALTDSSRSSAVFISAVSAFLASGRFSVMVATLSSTS